MVPVIAYHSIDDSGSFISISSRQFESQMQYLAGKHYRSILLKDFVKSSINGKPLPEKCFVLVFDDGFKNNFEIAFPILRKYGFTATIFIVTQFVGSKASWIKDNSVPVYPLLDWAEIAAMKAYGIDFQPHSKTHPDLTNLETVKISEEIENSKKEIEERLDSRAELFCYPHGKFNSRIKDAVAAADFKGGMTSIIGWNDPGFDPFTIKRTPSRIFRKHSSLFRLCLSRTGCELILLMLWLKKRGMRK